MLLTLATTVVVYTYCHDWRFEDSQIFFAILIIADTTACSVLLASLPNARSLATAKTP